MSVGGSASFYQEGTALDYRRVGQGPPVLVIPGVFSMAGDYAVFAEALGERFPVHTLERR